MVLPRAQVTGVPASSLTYRGWDTHSGDFWLCPSTLRGPGAKRMRAPPSRTHSGDLRPQYSHPSGPKLTVMESPLGDVESWLWEHYTEDQAEESSVPICQPVPLDKAHPVPHTVLSPKPLQEGAGNKPGWEVREGSGWRPPQGQVRGEGCAGRWGRQGRVT